MRSGRRVSPGRLAGPSAPCCAIRLWCRPAAKTSLDRVMYHGSSATRFGTPSLASTRRRWVFTVCSEMYRRLAAVSSVPQLAWSSSARANRDDKEASRPGCSMDDNYRPQTCICQSVWRLGAKRTCLPLLNCSQHEALHGSPHCAEKMFCAPRMAVCLSFSRRSYSAIRRFSVVRPIGA